MLLSTSHKTMFASKVAHIYIEIRRPALRPFFFLQASCSITKLPIFISSKIYLLHLIRRCPPPSVMLLQLMFRLADGRAVGKHQVPSTKTVCTRVDPKCNLGNRNAGGCVKRLEGYICRAFGRKQRKSLRKYEADGKIVHSRRICTG